MSIHHLERAAGLTMPPARKLVFMALCDDADKTTGLSFPGMEKMLAWAGCAKSQVHEHLTALIADGYVERVEAGRRGRRAVYRVFATVACCAEHRQDEGSGWPDPNEQPRPVDNLRSVPPLASGHPDPNPPLASGKRPERVRSGPDASLDSPTPHKHARTLSTTERAGGHVDKHDQVLELEQAFAARTRLAPLAPFRRLDQETNDKLARLVDQHGARRLADHAEATALTARSFRAFIPDWRDLPVHRTAADQGPRCDTCNHPAAAHPWAGCSTFTETRTA